LPPPDDQAVRAQLALAQDGSGRNRGPEGQSDRADDAALAPRNIGFWFSITPRGTSPISDGVALSWFGVKLKWM